MHTSYIGIQGQASGPIQIGNQGVWLQTTEQVNTNSNVFGTLSFVSKVGGSDPPPALCRLRAGLPSKDDPDSVVTVGFLEAYGFKPGLFPYDLADYVKNDQYQGLYKIVMGDSQSYNKPDSIEIRLTNVESTVDSFDHLNEQLTQQVQTINTQVDANTNKISVLQQQMDNVGSTIFDEPILFVAGNAESL